MSANALPGRPVILTRVPRSSMKTTTNKRRGTRCSLRRFRIEFLPTGSHQPSDRDEGYAYADNELAAELQKLGRRKAAFCAYVGPKVAQRLQIVALASPDEVLAAARRAKRDREDAEWEAAAPAAPLAGTDA